MARYNLFYFCSKNSAGARKGKIKLYSGSPSQLCYERNDVQICIGIPRRNTHLFDWVAVCGFGKHMLPRIFVKSVTVYID